MFAFLADVFAASGFVYGEPWARERDAEWRHLREALPDWWPVRLCRAPFLWSSAWLGRHRRVAATARWLWIASVLAALGWFGTDGVGAYSPVPMPGLLGDVTVAILVAAYAFYVPRIRGLVPLRFVKAALVLALLYGVFWAATSVVFHFAYRGTDIWSPGEWERLAAVWNRGGALYWQPFLVLLGLTAGWVVLIVLAWTRLPRVWLAVKRWSWRSTMWVIRGGFVLFTMGLLGRVFFDYGVVEFLYDYGASVAQATSDWLPGTALPAWAPLLVAAVLVLLVMNALTIVFEFISDAVCLVSKLLGLVVHGGVIGAERYDDEERPPKRVVGILERFAKAEEKAGAWLAHDAQTRRTRILVEEATSDLGEDGFTEPLVPPEGGVRPRTGGLLGRLFGRRKGAEEAVADGEEEVPAGGVSDAAEGPEAEAGEAVAQPPADGADEDAEEASEAAADTRDRDAFLAPDPVPGEAPAAAVPEAAPEAATPAPEAESDGDWEGVEREGEADALAEAKAAELSEYEKRQLAWEEEQEAKRQSEEVQASYAGMIHAGEIGDGDDPDDLYEPFAMDAAHEDDVAFSSADREDGEAFAFGQPYPEDAALETVGEDYDADGFPIPGAGVGAPESGAEGDGAEGGGRGGGWRTGRRYGGRGSGRRRPRGGWARERSRGRFGGAGGARLGPGYGVGRRRRG